MCLIENLAGISGLSSRKNLSRQGRKLTSDTMEEELTN